MIHSGGVDLFDGTIGVHYGFVSLAPEDVYPDLHDPRRGQRNGMIGAAVPGELSMITGTHTGAVRFTVRWLEHEPGEPEPQWEDVVEVSFVPTERTLVLSAFEEFYDLELPADGSLRVRYSARAMDAGHSDMADNPPDEYLLELWPAPPAPEEILRETSASASYWHRMARELSPPPTPEEVAAAAEKARQEQEESRRQALLAQWGGRMPSEPMLALGGRAMHLAVRDRALFDGLETLDDHSARMLARWLARRAFEMAGIADLDWAASALDALDAGQPLPIDMEEAFERVSPVTGESRLEVYAGFGYVRPDPHPLDRYEHIHRPSFAVPALFSAAGPDSLAALIETYDHAIATFHRDRGILRDEVMAKLSSRA